MIVCDKMLERLIIKWDVLILCIVERIVEVKMMDGLIKLNEILFG